MESPRTVRIYGLEKNRLEALADGIFAVSLTLLVLDIKLPDNAMAATSDELIALLIGLERHFVIYVISFTVIGMYWINHHIQFHFVRCTDRRLIWINMLYLLLVSFLPFATDLIGDHKELVLPCEVYGAALLALSFTSLLHLTYLARHPELAAASFTPEVQQVIARRAALFAVVPALSMLTALVSTHAAVYVYLLFAVIHFLPGRIDKHLAGDGDDGVIA